MAGTTPGHDNRGARLDRTYKQRIKRTAKHMPATILLTGFGPFPGAPFNPTGALVAALARRRYRGLPGARRVAHVFATSYAAVDRELPALMARERPDVLIMFGLAARSQHIRIETRARNAIGGGVPDASGHSPAARMIAPAAGAALSLRVPAQQLVAAVRQLGIPAALSRDAGDYLCNYLCWRAGAAGERNGAPRLIAFVHVPKVQRPSLRSKPAGVSTARRTRQSITFDDLVRAGEAIMMIALKATRG
ncbi:MAG TPA: pyroglutamyl-peptidase I [Xanthobacteraceae bacterium]|jgi:pyroglutamyl-peptidase